jgi:NADPH:quinone reductase-like Zn-dependent oxidoreductase
MKAAVYTKYGPPEVLKIKEVKKPTPKDNEVLIKIVATTVTSGDVRMRGFIVPAMFWLPMRLFLGFTGPRKPILGVDIGGEIEMIGKDVTKFKVGDKVFGSSYPDGGTYAEYLCKSEDGVIATKPSNMGLKECAAVFFGAHTALHFLKQANIKKGQKVLIHGASGAIGTYAVQLAKYFGAEVTGVCSTSNLELIKSIGADKVVDYTKEDFTKNNEKYDVIFCTVGKSPFSGSVKSLKKHGIYLRAVSLTLSSMLHELWTNITTNKKVIGGVAGENVEDLVFLRGLIEGGNLKPVIDRTYPLEEIVEAHRYVEKGHKKGNVVIIVSKGKS